LKQLLSGELRRTGKILRCAQDDVDVGSSAVGDAGAAMIANATESEKAREELRSLEQRLEQLLKAHPFGSKGFTKAGVRKMIARLHEEMAVFEGSQETRNSDS
jgi:hypothetical protein